MSGLFKDSLPKALEGWSEVHLPGFYLLPHTVGHGTARPVHFLILSSTQTDIDLEPDAEALQALTYRLCFLYYNSVEGRACKLPAPLMYTQKLSSVVGLYLKKAIFTESMFFL